MALVDVNAAAVHAAAEELTSAGHQAVGLPCDVSAEEAGEDLDRVNAVNYRGVWAAMKHELRQMHGQGSGAIVNCSSIGGLMGSPGRAAYHASKHAVIGLTKCAAREYAPHGIRINAICPGTIATAMVDQMVATGALDQTAAVEAIPLGRLGRGAAARREVTGCCFPARQTTSMHH